MGHRDLLVTHRYLMESEANPFLEPWEQLPPDRAAAFEAEVQRELSPEHPLHGVTLSALACSHRADDVSFGWMTIASSIST